MKMLTSDFNQNRFLPLKIPKLASPLRAIKENAVIKGIYKSENFTIDQAYKAFCGDAVKK